MKRWITSQVFNFNGFFSSLRNILLLSTTILMEVSSTSKKREIKSQKDLKTSLNPCNLFLSADWGWIVCSVAFLAHILTTGFQLSYGFLLLYAIKHLGQDVAMETSKLNFPLKLFLLSPRKLLAMKRNFNSSESFFRSLLVSCVLETLLKVFPLFLSENKFLATKFPLVSNLLRHKLGIVSEFRDFYDVKLSLPHFVKARRDIWYENFSNRNKSDCLL